MIPYRNSQRLICESSKFTSFSAIVEFDSITLSKKDKQNSLEPKGTPSMITSSFGVVGTPSGP